MFEAMLLPQRRGRDARLIRWIAFGSIAGQVIAVTAFVVIPLIYPDTLPSLIRPPKLTHVEFKRPEIKIIPPTPRVLPVSSQSAVSMPAHMAPAVLETRQSAMMSRPSLATDIEPALVIGGGDTMRTSFSAATGGGGSEIDRGTSPIVVVAKPASTAPDGPVRVSSGVSKGLLIDPIRPIYPVIAKAAHQQGTVVVTAVIDRTGHIVNAQVTDGPLMLRDAAITAVREARYHPYLLNGQPTEVVTTISISFVMGA